MSDEIRRSAVKLIDFLKDNAVSNTLRFPYHYLFPKNCCESASLIFSELIKVAHPDAHVSIVRGTNCQHDHHFWLEINGLAFDLTACQFEDIDAPVLGQASNPLAKEYVPDDGQPLRELIDGNTVRAFYQAGTFGL